MNRTSQFSRMFLAVSACIATMALPVPASAATYYLKTEAFTIPDPNGGDAIPMWGYMLCQDSTFNICDPAPSVPGPALNVRADDSTLQVKLSNTLNVPTSLVINGLIKPMTPVWDDDSTGGRPSPSARVRSFDLEAKANGYAEYTWTNVKPGTYLYQSGTQPQVQVQMGLYGAMTKNNTDAGTGISASAYAGVPYDNQATLLYSEIDPVLHTAVATDNYGKTGTVTSTFHYAPKYFLINGQPYPSVSSSIRPTGSPGRTLLRLLNAGLTTHVPMIQGANWSPVAEDGKPYKYATNQYTALLPAAKTMDVVLVADSGGATYPVIDRRLNLSNNGLSDGGMLTNLVFGAAGAVGAVPSNGSANAVPITNDDTYKAVKGVTLNVNEQDGVLANDSDADGLPMPIRAVAVSGSTVNGGTFALNANGSFIYTPSATSTATTDSFTYRATDGLALSNPPSKVTINLVTPTAPTLPSLDEFERTVAQSLGTGWAQASNTANGADLQAAGTVAKAVNANLGGLAIWSSGNPFGATQGAQFTVGEFPLHSALVLKASGGTVAAPANYVRVRYESNNGNNEMVVSTMIGGNNISVFVKQAAFPATLQASETLSAVVDSKGMVTVFKNGDFLGGVQLPDVATWKGNGRIGMQLQTSGATIDSFKGGTLP